MNPPDRIAAGISLPPWSVLPFAGLLFSMALLPVFAAVTLLFL